MDIGIVKSKKVCSDIAYFVGVSYRKLYAANRKQIRIGLYFFHICITWTVKSP